MSLRIDYGRSLLRIIFPTEFQMYTLRFTAPLLLATTLMLGGCFSFSGPSDVRRQITSVRDVKLERDEAFSVGPLGVLLVSTFAGPYLPFNPSGISNVDFGTYTIEPLSLAQDDNPLRLASLELPGWERIVRVHENGSDTVVMVDPDTDRLNRLLVLQREGDELTIVRASGRLDKVIDNLLDSEWADFWPLEGEQQEQVTIVARREESIVISQ